MPILSQVHPSLLFLLLLLITPQFSASRPINGFRSANMPAMDPGLNIALPKEILHIPPLDSSPPTVSPCNLASPVSTKSSASSKAEIEEKYKPLLLNLLPRGKVPPSGPSKGTNNHNS
ncbi:hypothetical protein COCNU_04G004400 [Cocos nucifera]|uniref:Uncharacterized protein n=1 Tax=Cocos nucifera TaxID=13894 RepID=A0A8K0N0E5_COCNU|nr:hypothetical protein COCNU_04G004400 [Cocos nucifera]